MLKLVWGKGKGGIRVKRIGREKGLEQLKGLKGLKV
jgi:hypothetical protein